MIENYNPIGVTKSRICSIIANSERCRKVIDYKGTDATNPYDPEDPMTLMWNCIYPCIKDITTITTVDPQILIGVNSQRAGSDPRQVRLTVTIIIVVDYQDNHTDISYVRDDLAEKGIVCYTKVDAIADEIIKALSSEQSITWIGDIIVNNNDELVIDKMNHYARRIQLTVPEINIGNRGI